MKRSRAEPKPQLVELYAQGMGLYRRLAEHMVHAPMVMVRATSEAEVERWRLRVEQLLADRPEDLERFRAGGEWCERSRRKHQLQSQLAQLRQLVAESAPAGRGPDLP